MLPAARGAPMRPFAARHAAVILLAFAALSLVGCGQDDTALIPEDGEIRTEDPGLSGPTPTIDGEALGDGEQSEG